MSQLQVTTLESNRVSANVVTAGPTTVNSSGLFLNKSESEYSGVISTSSLVVSESDLNYTLSAEFENSSDSYTASGATLTNFDTYIRITATSNDSMFISPTISYYGTQIGKIVIKIRRIAGSGWDGSVFYATGSHGYTESYKFMMTQPNWVGTDWAYIQLDGSKLFAGGNDFITSTITGFRFDFGNTISDIFEIDYIRYYPVNVLIGTVSTPSIKIGDTNYASLITEVVNTQIFTSNGTWSKPSWANTGNELVVVHAWGGGGGGYLDAGAGGGGGAFVFGYFKSSQCNSTCNVVVGRAGLNQPFNAATAGGDSIFYANTTNSLVAYGGGPGRSDLSTQAWGGGGGGWLSAGSGNTSGTYPGGPLTRSANSSVNAIDSTFGGGGGAWGNSTTGSRSSTSSVYGGGGGAGANTSLVLGVSSVFGGAGGRSTGPVLGSIYGGSGGNNTVAATAPGGGGGAGSAAARGEVRVYTYKIIDETPVVFSTVIDDLTANTITVPVTGAQLNDLIVVFTFDGDGRTHLGNANFNTATTNSSGNSGAGLFWKIASASEPANYVFTTAGSATAIGAICVIFRGYEFGGNSDAISDNANSLTLPSVILPSNNNKKIVLTAVGGRMLGTYTLPQGFNILFEDADATKATYYMAWKLTDESGSTGDLTINSSESNHQTGVLFYLNKVV